MRTVGPGHAFHLETGECRRCGLSMVDPLAAAPCAKADDSPHPPTSTKAPDPYADSAKQAK